ncbi:MAG: hypothetical protein ACTSUG_13955, partial [Candidatus Helarchaeota archaeon]
MAKNKTFLFSILLFLIIFISFAYFKNWWFFGADDFHKLYLGYQTKSWKDLLYFFYEGHTNQGAGPSNFIHSTERTTFFGTLYRPFHCIFFALRYWLFGAWAYPYFLLNIFFHALNTVILFNIFLWFINYIPAFLLSLFFAFHPQIAYRFGAAVNFHYYVNVFITFLIFLLFKKYLDSRKYLFYFLSCFLFAFSLFVREVTIVLPGILSLGAYLYQNRFKKINFKNFFNNFFYNLKLTSGYWVTAISFLTIRLYLYPIKLDSVNKPHTSFFIEKIEELKVFFFDMYSLSWLPWGHKIIRGTILITLLSLTLLLFIKNKKKIYVAYFFLSTFL